MLCSRNETSLEEGHDRVYWSSQCLGHHRKTLLHPWMKNRRNDVFDICFTLCVLVFPSFLKSSYTSRSSEVKMLNKLKDWRKCPEHTVTKIGLYLVLSWQVPSGFSWSGLCAWSPPCCSGCPSRSSCCSLVSPGCSEVLCSWAPGKPPTWEMKQQLLFPFWIWN